MVLRFLLITLLCFLLMGPVLRTLTREVEKPVVILALDESRSVLNGKDSLKRKEEIKNAIERLNNGLGQEFDLRLFSFGDRIRDKIDYSFEGKSTDISGLYSQLDVQFSNRNVGAIILATDGLYNEGANPAYGPERLKVPVYPIALGDTTIRKDLMISDVRQNRVAFLGNTFPLGLVIDARQAGGASTLLTVEEDSVPLFSRTMNVTGNSFHTEVPVFLQARSKGIHHYKVKLAPVAGEVTAVNNVRDVFIEVVEQKQKVLILSAAPHPDVAALRNVLESGLNYETVVQPVTDFKGLSGNYNLVILHGLPDDRPQSRALMQQLEDADVATWFIMGPNTALELISNAGAGITVAQANGKINDVLPQIRSDFSLFNVPEEVRGALPGWPPLKSPFGIYTAQPGSTVFLQQKIGSVQTGQPLFLFFEKGGRKSAVLAGEGIWRWSMSDFSETGSRQRFRDLVFGIVQYLSVQEPASPFRVMAKNSYRENEPLVIDARLYNQSGQLVNTPDVKIKIVNDAGNEFVFTMSRSDQAYYLNAGLFPVGRYRYSAEVRLGTVPYTASGQFNVSALQLETASVIADHQLLSVLAARTGGTVFYPGEAERLVENLLKNENLKSVSFMHKQLKDLVSEPWIFFLLILFLSVEWFIRKRSGGY